MTPVSHGKPCAGNPHARFEEGASAPETPRRNALLHNNSVRSRSSAISTTGTSTRIPNWRRATPIGPRC